MGPTVLDLFAGAVGGWSIGLHRAGYRTVAACEIDPWRRAMFAAEFPDAEMFDDVRTVTADALRSRLGCLPDVVVGSPPCQSFSVAGLGAGLDDPRGQLFAEYLRIVGEVRPVWCAAENVPGLARRGLEWVVAELDRAGYRVDVLDIGAENLGAPHRRRRLWIIGTRRDVADAAEGGRRNGQGAEAEGRSGEQRSEQSVQLSGGPQGCGGEDASDAASARHQGAGPVGAAAGMRRQPSNTLGADAPDADPPELRQQSGRQRGSGRPADTAEPRDDGQAGAGSNAHGQRLAIDQSQSRDRGTQCPALVGVDWLDAWASWHGGCAGHIELAHGAESRVARPLIAAIGDAVMPDIAEALGRTMKAMVGIDR